MARTSGIGLLTAKQTLEVTTQHPAKRGDRPHGLGRRLRSMHKRITDRFRISARVYVDTMKSKVPTIGGDKCAQVFTTAYHFTKVIFGKDEKGPTVAFHFFSLCLAPSRQNEQPPIFGVSYHT